MKIRVKILAPTLALMVGGIMLVALAGTIISIRSATDAARDSALYMAHSLSERVDTWVLVRRDQVVNWSMQTLFANTIGDGFVARQARMHAPAHIKSYMEEFPFLEALDIVDRRGDVLVSSDPASIGEPFANRTLFKTVMGGEAFMSEPMISRLTGDPVVVMAVPFLSGAGEAMGVLAVHISLRQLADAYILHAATGEHGYTFLLARNGLAIAHPDEKHVMTQDFFAASYGDLLRRGTGLVDYRDNGRQIMAALGTVPQTGWIVAVNVDSRDINAPARRMGIMIGGIALTVLFVTGLIMFLVSRSIARPIQTATRIADSIAGGNLLISVDENAGGEIGQLNRALSKMSGNLKEARDTLEMKVLQRTEELNASNEELLSTNEELNSLNEELHTTIEHLNEVREKMIEQEKLASLGGLVAGVAHEVNTPIGSALTAVTFLAPLLEELHAKLAANALRRADFATFLEGAGEAVKLAIHNLTRASDLVASFKKISVEQSADQFLDFDVAVSIHDVLLSLRHEYKNKPIHIETECPDPGILRIRNYPGAFVQILTNLIMNSIRHGLKDTEDGIISITVRQVEDRVTLFYSDNGCGMTEEVRARTFDPFFTTARGDGGTGLGMSIVYNLVTQRMRGTLDLKTAPGEGVLFIIEIPVSIVPARVHV